MKSNFDTGHFKNLCNFDDLISFCAAQGSVYNPGTEALTINKLNELKANAAATVQQCNSTKTTFDIATNARRIAFRDFQPFATKIINALAASGISDLTLDDARGINRKIQGARTKKKPATGNDSVSTTKTISTSQLSFINKMEHFAELIAMLSIEPAYKPNEPELKLDGLKSKLANMRSLNSALINAYTIWSNARILRDKTLYDRKTGLVPTALHVKKYVKSVFGSSSPIFHHVNGIDFRKYKTM